MVEGSEAHLVDDAERSVEIEPCSLRLRGGITASPLSTSIRVIEHEVGGAEPVLDVLHAERHREGLFPTPGGPMKRTLSALAYECARGEGLSDR